MIRQNVVTRKILSIIISLFCVLALVSCGNNDAVTNPVMSETKSINAENEASKDNTKETVKQEETAKQEETKVQKKKWTIGIGQFAEHSSLDNCRLGFIKGLEESGLKAGEDFVISYDNAQTDGATATQIFNSYLSRKMDMMVAIATPMAQSAYAVCRDTTTPVIYTAITDPIAAELADEFKQPVGNITGTSDKLPVEAQLKMIKTICPDAKKVGILYTTSEVNSISSINDYKKVSKNYDIEIIDIGVGQSSDLTLAIDNILNQVDVITNVTDNTVVASLPILLQKANEKKIPVFGSEIEQVKLGCIGCVGLDYVKLGIQTGKMAYRVLKGEDIKTIPYETITEADLYLNTEAINNLNLAVTDDYLKTAREVFNTIQ